MPAPSASLLAGQALVLQPPQNAPSGLFFFFPEDDCAAFFPQHSPLHMSPLLLLLFLDLKFTLVVKIFFFPETLFNSEHCITLKENGFF